MVRHNDVEPSTGLGRGRASVDPAVLQVLQDRLGFLLGLEGDLRNGAMLGPVIVRADQDAMWRGPVRAERY